MPRPRPLRGLIVVRERERDPAGRIDRRRREPTGPLWNAYCLESPYAADIISRRLIPDRPGSTREGSSTRERVVVAPYKRTISRTDHFLVACVTVFGDSQRGLARGRGGGMRERFFSSCERASDENPLLLRCRVSTLLIRKREREILSPSLTFILLLRLYEA